MHLINKRIAKDTNRIHVEWLPWCNHVRKDLRVLLIIFMIYEPTISIDIKKAGSKFTRPAVSGRENCLSLLDEQF